MEYILNETSTTGYCHAVVIQAPSIALEESIESAMAGLKMESNAIPAMDNYFNVGELDFDMGGDLSSMLNGHHDTIQNDTGFLSDGMLTPDFLSSHPSRGGSVLSSNESNHWTHSYNSNSGTLLQNVGNPLVSFSSRPLLHSLYLFRDESCAVFLTVTSDLRYHISHDTGYADYINHVCLRSGAST